MRYIFFAATNPWSDCAAPTLPEGGFDLIWRTEHVLAFVAGTASAPAFANKQCLLIGDVFRKSNFGPSHGEFTNHDADEIAASQGRVLAKKYWGRYLAIISGDVRGGSRFFRDPLGLMPCYYLELEGCTALASDAAALEPLLGAANSPDFDTIAEQLLEPGLPRSRTAIAGVCELLAGEFLTIGQEGPSVERHWTPAASADSPSELSSWEEPRKLRELVHSTHRCWASRYKQPLVTVSGGLDSSIVANALSSIGVQFGCLTMATNDPDGDERQYARLLVKTMGVDLIERKYSLDAITLTRSSGMHLPRPFGRIIGQAYAAAAQEVAIQQSADALVTGTGGDNIFMLSYAAHPVVDRLYSERSPAGVAATIRDLARLTGSAPSRVLRAAFSNWVKSRSTYKWPRDSRFLNTERIASIAPGTHPWLDEMRGSLPGKILQVVLLLRCLDSLETFDPVGSPPQIAPLLSQPLVEFCLRIPSWRWIEGGVDRSLARTAFREDLPAQIINRATKGGPDSFAYQIVSSMREEIISILLDGALVANHVLDRSSIELALREWNEYTSIDHLRILACVEAEAWVQNRLQRFRPLSRIP